MKYRKIGIKEETEILNNFYYDKNTGFLYRKYKTGNNQHKGPIKTEDFYGYLITSLKRKRYFVHRIIWFLSYGYWPDQVDHKNGNKKDNKLCNLRKATSKENRRNMRLRENNKCGFKGVHYAQWARKYRAMISINKKSMHLGYFDTPKEAHEAYKKAAKKYFGEFARYE